MHKYQIEIWGRSDAGWGKKREKERGEDVGDSGGRRVGGLVEEKKKSSR